MKKVSDILLNTIRSILPPLITLIVSAYIIRFSQASVWGEIVERILIIGLLNQIMNWGHREYLMRAFSFNPSGISSLFMNTLFSRMTLLLPSIGILVFIFHSSSDIIWITIWLIASFLHQSFDVLVVYQKSFKTHILAELTGLFIVIIGLVYLRGDLGLVETFAKFFALGLIIKSIILSLHFHKIVSFKQNISFQFSFFKEALPFLLIGFSGMLLTKADIYVIGLIAPEKELGEYQILITFFIYLQALGSFIATPFLKQMYRISIEKFNSISLKFSIGGTLLSLFAMPVIYLVIEVVYSFSLPFILYVAGFLAVIPVYLYLPSIVNKYRTGAEKQVIFINLLAAGISAIATFYLYELFELTGAVMAVAITQWILVFFYRVFSGRVEKVNEM